MSEIEIPIGGNVGILLPEDFLDKLENGMLEQEHLESYGNTLRAHGIINLVLDDVIRFAATRGKVKIRKKLAQIPIYKELRITWTGSETRTKYKELFVDVIIAESEEEKWTTFLTCIAASAALSVWFASLATETGPIAWLIWVAAVNMSCPVCLETDITPDALREFKNGFVWAQTRWGI